MEQKKKAVTAGAVAYRLGFAHGKLLELMKVVEENGGELSPQMDRWITDVLSLRAENIDLAKMVLRAAQAHAADLIKQADEIYAMAAGIARAEKSLSEVLKQTMRIEGVSEINGQTWRAQLTKAAPRLVIDDPTLVPERFFQTTITLQRDVVLDALKKGEDVPGVHLEDNHSLRWYPARVKQLTEAGE